MSILIEKLVAQDHHRNGISGQPFDVAIFESEGRRMLGIVLDEDADSNTGYVNCFVLDIDKLAAGNITFGSNSWRGDNFASELRAWIASERQPDTDEVAL